VTFLKGTSKAALDNTDISGVWKFVCGTEILYPLHPSRCTWWGADSNTL